MMERKSYLGDADRMLGASTWHSVALLRGWLHWALKEGIMGWTSRNGAIPW